MSHGSPVWLIIVPDAPSGRSTIITPSTQGTRVSTWFDQGWSRCRMIPWNESKSTDCRADQQGGGACTEFKRPILDHKIHSNDMTARGHLANHRCPVRVRRTTDGPRTNWLNVACLTHRMRAGCASCSKAGEPSRPATARRCERAGGLKVEKRCAEGDKRARGLVVRPGRAAGEAELPVLRRGAIRSQGRPLRAVTQERCGLRGAARGRGHAHSQPQSCGHPGRSGVSAGLMTPTNHGLCERIRGMVVRCAVGGAARRRRGSPLRCYMSRCWTLC